MRRNSILCFAVPLLFGAVIGEQVWLRDLNSDVDKRNLEIGGLPSNLKFALFRQGSGNEFELNLVENRRLGANAPVFEVKKTSGGKQTLVRKKSVPNRQTKYYQDRKSNGVFMVTCKKQRIGACQRMVEGIFDIDGEQYNLTPSQEPTLLRGVNRGGVPHELVQFKPEDTERLYEVADYAEIEDRQQQQQQQQRNELVQELTYLLRNKDTIDKILQGKYRREKRAENTYAIEVVVAIDPSLWKKYYDDLSEISESERDEATEQKLKQYFAHIFNAVSLRYQSIDDAELNMYVSLSGFLFYKDFNEDNPVPSSAVVTVNGVGFAEVNQYINSLVPWASTLQNLPDNDHIAVFTGYDLYSVEPMYNSVAGIAWLGGVCNDYRVSLNEAGTYFETMSVAAHELGHNLNASHDNSTECPSTDSFIMAPSTTNFQLGEAYSVNPWRFSQCSIDSFKSYIESLGTGTGNCLLDNGDYYDSSEYEDHVATEPGELYTLDEQCELLRGDNSKLYTELTDAESEEICRTMACIDENDYYAFYAAARGTPCGPASEDKWCKEGLCVTKTETNTGDTDGTNTDNTNDGTNTDNTNDGTNTDNTNDGTNTDNTNNGTNTDNTNDGTNTDNTNDGTNTDNTNNGTNTDNTDGSEECVNTGYFDGTWTWSCDELNTYFKDNYNAEPVDWCADTTNGWANYCCEMCSGDTDGTNTDNTNDGTNTDNTNDGTNTDNTNDGTNTDNTDGSEECVNTGYFDGTWTWSCDELNTYFKDNYNAEPVDWCADTTNGWANYCCEMCSDASIGTDTNNTDGTTTDGNGEVEECVDTGFYDGTKTWSCNKLKRYFRKYENAKPKDWCRDTVNGWADYCCEMCSAYVK